MITTGQGIMTSFVQECSSTPVPVAMLVFLGCCFLLLILNDVRMLGFGALMCFLIVMLMHLLLFRALVDVTYLAWESSTRFTPEPKPICASYLCYRLYHRALHACG
jgi:hypothetical protein